MPQIKEIYKNLYQEICQLDSSAWGASLGQVINQLAIESKGNFLEIDKQLNGSNLSKGAILIDQAGIAIHTLAYHLAYQWSMGTSFKAYDLVLVIPLEYSAFLQESGDPSTAKLLTLWNCDEEAKGKILFILSGYSSVAMRSNQKLQSIKEKWLNFCRTNDHVIISHDKPDHFTAKEIYNISLKPLNLKINHYESEAYIPGSLILEEAITATEQVFFHQKSNNSIQTGLEFHKQIMNFMLGKDFKVSQITVDHIYNAFTSQELIEILEENFQKKQRQSSLKQLTTPSEWFCAAITAQDTKFDKKFFSYNIANHFIVRNKENQYIFDLGSIENLHEYVQEKILNFDSNDERLGIKNLLNLLTSLKLQEDISIMSADQIKNAMTNLRKPMAQKQELSKKSFKTYNKLLDMIHKPNDNIAQLSSGDKGDVSYSKIQMTLNNEINELKENDEKITISEVARKIYEGELIAPLPSLILGLSACSISETARHPVNFLATQALIDLVENSQADQNSLWKKFFCHSHLCKEQKDDNLTQSILFNIAHTLGGLQPMTHANSFKQVYTKSLEKKSTMGLNWAEYKSLRLFLEWLCLILTREKHINPHIQAKIIEAIPPNNQIIIKNLLFDFLGLFINRLNPYIFDRFARRLEHFKYMLNPTISASNQLPPNANKIVPFITNFNGYIGAIRHGMPKSIHDGPVSKSMLSTPLFQFYDAIKTGQEPNWVEQKLKHLLKVDPDFYQVHYYLARLYLNRIREYKNALEHINQFLKICDPNKGDFYFVGLYNRIRINYNLGHYDNMNADINFYFQHYHDQSDMDYWRVHAIRGMWKYGFKIKGYQEDLNLFLKNVPKEDTDEYIHVRNMMNGDYEEALNNLKENQSAYLTINRMPTIWKKKQNNSNVNSHDNEVKKIVGNNKK